MSRYSLFFQFLLMTLLLHLDIPQIQAQDPIDQRLQPYIDILDTYGEEPENFVIGKLTDHDLLIFDDAWHPAVEPFEFYQKLIKNPSFSNKITYIFVEAFPINKQKYIDAYLNAPQEDNKILYPLFQDDFSGEGWPLKTYFGLMETLYYINSGLPPESRIRVLAVNSPTYWSEISTHEDLELFRKTLVGNDYTMYKIILNAMDRFNSGQKGIFLTNTRHAYKGIKDTNGNFFWNCGTFFHQ